MKKLLSFILIGGLLFTTASVQAQFRSIPGVVTDSFKVRYPSATTVSWEDKVTSFQATFTLNNEKYQAKYNKDGSWISSDRKIKEDALPAVVKDGLSKSKYAEWKVGTITQRYFPGDSVNYIIFVAKSDITRKNLTFSTKGQLLKDNTTL